MVLIENFIEGIFHAKFFTIFTVESLCQYTNNKTYETLPDILPKDKVSVRRQNMSFSIKSIFIKNKQI